jgi:hypothetical protein
MAPRSAPGASSGAGLTRDELERILRRYPGDLRER